MYASERRRRMWKQIKDTLIQFENELLNDIYVVTVGGVSFSKCGDLYVEFIDISSKESIDFYGYKNMNENELY